MNSEKSPALLMLLMLAAHGAMGSSLYRVGNFAWGLIEICRITVFGVLEKKIQLSTDPIIAPFHTSISEWGCLEWKQMAHGGKYSSDLPAAHSQLLAYSWIVCDQELSPFHDHQPDFDAGELNAPVPDEDGLWNTGSAETWGLR
ncbi:hypothetical protein K504DRAFT_450136 [Pleomassaria siparia CBS 279.74]|uniref:Uncharacterized protein n=1 Tax=Pleomassaria siparia CBS 279.74 TaxID=1314801 RepID=A0A6G1KKW4_9PLEO|nr:hypothetical protein K504DRAFT_450136 [Pleomassaria siparia CBS 279.74]